MKMPHVYNRQTKRVNVSSNNPEEYFVVSMFIPLLDHLLSRLYSRSDERLKRVLPLRDLAPNNLHVYNDDLILSTASVYENDLPNSIPCLSTQLRIWRNR